MSFDSAMSQVAATMGTTVDSISELRDFAQEMGATTAFSATQSAEALNYMALAGYDAETSMSMLPNVLNLAAAGGMELARASDMITDASSALGLSLDETSELVDKMAMASSKSNTSVAQLGDAILTVGGTAKNLAGGTTELSAALGILADNGIKGAEGGTALRNIILSLSAPTDKAAAKMEELGVAAYDNEGNLRSLNDIFTDLNGALSTMTQGEQTDVLNTLFNKVDLKSANALLANTGDRFNELTGYINDAAGAADDMAKVQLDNLAGDITLFQSALEGAQIAISDSLTPTLREFVQFGSDAVSTLGTAFKEGGLTGAMDALGTILSDGIAMITEKLPEFVEAGMGLLSALGQGLLDNLPMLAQAATEIILNLTQFIIQALPELIQAGFMIISTVAQGLAEALPELIPAIVDVILEIVDVLTQPDNIVLLLDAAIAIVIGLADGIMKSLPKLLERMPEIIVNVVGALIAAIPELIEGVLDLGYAIITGIVDGAMSVMDNLGEIWESVKEAFSGAWDKIKETWAGVGDWFGEKWSDIKSRFAETKEWFGEKFEDAKTAVQDAWANIGDWFGERKEDVQNAWNTVDTWMGDKFGGAWDLAKKPFEMAGEFFSGVWEGIKEIFAVVQDVLSGDFEGAWDGIKGIWDQVVGFFDGIWTDIQNIFSGVGTWFSDKFDEAVDGVKKVFTGLIDSALTWGSDLVDNFIGGIKSMWGNFTGTLSDLAGTVTSFLGFSEPEKGPLSDFHTYAPDMMDLFIKGIENSEGKLRSAVADAFDFQPIINAGVPSGTTYSGTGNVNVTVNAAPGQSVEAVAQEVERRILNAFANRKQVYA